MPRQLTASVRVQPLVTARVLVQPAVSADEDARGAGLGHPIALALRDAEERAEFLDLALDHLERPHDLPVYLVHVPECNGDAA